jgi:transposase
MGTITDAETGRDRKVHALIFTAVYSRHMFVWLTYTQTLAAVIAGCEMAWAFFGGVFKVLMPDYVPRNIIGLLWPAGLCGPSRR